MNKNVQGFWYEKKLVLYNLLYSKDNVQKKKNVISIYSYVGTNNNNINIFLNICIGTKYNGIKKK